ncbi:helix-turn-helix domain-containing protein [Amycolatopsis speibonae]|uniref:Transposase family protein n=1 Tax=Amycolatopsis speibonae TaxID=1450224 RepID=A0ABV7P7W7_9PSEU
MSSTMLRYVAGVTRGHRRRIGSPWRRLPPGRQGLLVLAYLRNGDTYARLTAGFGISIATVFRYVRETTTLLAAQAPTLASVLWQLAWSRTNYAILDGIVIRTDRIAANRPYFAAPANAASPPSKTGTSSTASAAVPTTSPPSPTPSSPSKTTDEKGSLNVKYLSRNAFTFAHVFD